MIILKLLNLTIPIFFFLELKNIVGILECVLPELNIEDVHAYIAVMAPAPVRPTSLKLANFNCSHGNYYFIAFKMPNFQNKQN